MENRISRRRYQQGSITKEPDRWVIRWREDIRDPSTGNVKRVKKWDVLSKKLTKTEVKRELALRLEKINCGDYMPTAGGVTFATFAEKWQRELLIHFKPSTQHGYISIIRCHLVPALGPFQLSDITLESVQGFVNRWKISLASGAILAP